MRYQGILLTGTSGSGKSTLANEICALDSRFTCVKAVTTRAKRSDDSAETYDYITEKDFCDLVKKKKLLVQATYREQYYGIRLDDVEHTLKADKIPILTITPESAADLTNLKEDKPKPLPNQFMSVFVDVSDCELERRLRKRNGMITEEVMAQREKDRSFKDTFLYSIQNEKLEISVELLISLWEYLGKGGVLSDRLIRLMLKSKLLLDRSNIENVSGASYDLSLGDEYFYAGRIHRLTTSKPILIIEPYDYAIVTSYEVSNLPKDICARFDLSVSLFCQGIILSNGPQIDPGFRGPLFCLLFNTSSSPVLLKRRQHYATIEFHKLIEPTYSYQGHYRAKDLLHYLPSNAAQGAINELKKELEQVRRESQKLQNTTWAILSLILALIAVWLTLK